MNTFNEVIERYAAQIRTADVIEIADIPTIDLYMDQVTTFMDKGLARYKRNETDKILTLVRYQSQQSRFQPYPQSRQKL